jgi:hypothetical protein
MCGIWEIWVSILDSLLLDMIYLNLFSWWASFWELVWNDKQTCLKLKINQWVSMQKLVRDSFSNRAFLDVDSFKIWNNKNFLSKHIVIVALFWCLLGIENFKTYCISFLFINFINILMSLKNSKKVMKS